MKKGYSKRHDCEWSESFLKYVETSRTCRDVDSLVNDKAPSFFSSKFLSLEQWRTVNKVVQEKAEVECRYSFVCAQFMFLGIFYTAFTSKVYKKKE